MADKKYFGGIDVGTTGCKISVFDTDGALLNTYYKEYSSKHQNGEHEIDFCDVKNGVFEILKQAVDDCELCAVGVTSFGETFAMLDENDNILSSSMLYTDPRGKEQCDYLFEKLDRNWYTSVTGVKPDAMYSIAKLMWQRDNNKLFGRCKKILLGEDFIIYTLTGQRFIDHSLAARTAAFDIVNKQWCREIFDAAGIDVSLMSAPVPTGTVAGEISDDIKALLGIDYSFKVICGGQDQIAAMIGAGVFEKGVAMDGTGTVECIPVILDSVPDNPKLYDGGYSVVPFINGKYACYALSFTGGATLKWFRDNLAKETADSCAKQGVNTYSYLDSISPKSPTSILVLPHFAGAATPYMDPLSRAAFVGISLETTKQDIYRALMEGTAYEILLNFNILKEYTGQVNELRATGGGASSPLWLSIKADILGSDICAMTLSDTGTVGAAALAAVGVGLFDSLNDAVGRLCKVKARYSPNQENKEFYSTQYEKYKNLYKAIKSL